MANLLSLNHIPLFKITAIDFYVIITKILAFNVIKKNPYKFIQNSKFLHIIIAYNIASHEIQCSKIKMKVVFFFSFLIQIRVTCLFNFCTLCILIRQ